MLHLSSNVPRGLLQVVVHATDFLHLDDVVEDVLQVEVLLQQRVLEAEKSEADAADAIADRVRLQLKRDQVRQYYGS